MNEDATVAEPLAPHRRRRGLPIHFVDVGTVLRKELRETLRDRRTLAVMILFPLVVYPLLSLLMAQVMAGKQSQQESRRSRIALWGMPTADAQEVRRLLQKDRSIDVIEMDVPALGARKSEAWSRAQIDLQARRIDAFVALDGTTTGGSTSAPTPPGASAAASGSAAASRTSASTDVRAAIATHVLYDETHDESEKARTRAEALLGAQLPAGCTRSYAVKATSVTPPSQVGGYILSKILPLIVVMMTMLGAFYPAIDITAGERERGTLETLLSSPVERFDLMLGKVLAVTTLAALTGTLNIASMSLTVAEGARMAGGSSAFSIPWTRAAATILTVLPAAFLWGSVMVAVGALARSFKEAQNLLTPVYFLCFTPALVAGLGEWTLTGAALFVPGTNLTLLARDLMLGEATLAHIAVVTLVTLFTGGLALAFAARMYDSERLLASPDSSQIALRSWVTHLVFGRRRWHAAATDTAVTAEKRAHPSESAWGEAPRTRPRDDGAPDDATAALPTTAAHAMVVFAIAFVLWFFAFSWLQRWDLIGGILVSQWGGFLGLVLVYSRVVQAPVRDVLWLHRPSRRATFGALLLGASAWVILGILADKFMSPPRDLIESMRKLIRPADGHRTLAVSLLVLALTPAVCEEALFRGVILRGLRTRFAPAASCVLTGILFGILHGDVWRLLPTTLLGILLSWVALSTRSLVPAILIHASNNAALVTLGYFGWDEAAETLPRPVEVLALTAAVVIFAMGTALDRTKSTPTPQATSKKYFVI